MIQIDMDMPKSCDVCDFIEEVNGKLYCGNPVGMIKGEYVDDCIMTRHEDCPLIEVEQKWIPCSERLPEDGDYKAFSYYEDGAVLFCTKDGKIGFGWYYESTKQWANEDDKFPGEVIAWLPLPEPYKGGENE